MKPFASSRSLIAAAMLSGLAWIVLGAAFAAQLVFSGSLTWETALRISVRDWMPWALLSPWVFGMAIAFPLERGRWVHHLPVHLAACLLSLMACEWLGHYLRPPAEAGGPPIGVAPEPGMPRRHPPPDPRGPPGGPGGFEEPGSSGPPRLREDRPGRPQGPGSRGFPGLPGGALSARARLNLPVFWVVVCGAHALLFYRRSQERERRSLELAASLARAKLEALRMQLQPHFLFNTLNAISTLVHRDPRAADEMIGNLSDFLRLTLENADRQEIPLGEELKFVEHYLAIERVRFGERLRVEVAVPADLLATPVPSLLLQPLVENAVRHGLEPLGSGGLLRIVGKRQGDRLWLAVIDNGRGLPATPPERSGIGMANTRERLSARYGAAASVSLHPAEGGGTSAEILLPLKSVAPGPDQEPE